MWISLQDSQILSWEDFLDFDANDIAFFTASEMTLPHAVKRKLALLNAFGTRNERKGKDLPVGEVYTKEMF